MNSKQTIETLFNQATDEGLLGAESQTILIQNLNESVIAGAAGKRAEEVDATEVTLVTVVIDDSGSITAKLLVDAVREGQNALVRALGGSKQQDSILIAQWKLGSVAELIHSYVPVNESVLLDASNYNPSSGTALYDVWMDALASNVAYAQTLAATGTQVRSVALVITDGRDESSRKYRARDCAVLASDLLSSESFHLAFIGVGEQRMFNTVAEEMGFARNSILTASATESEIRKAINFASQSIIRASQGLIRPGANSGFFNAAGP